MRCEMMWWKLIVVVFVIVNENVIVIGIVIVIVNVIVNGEKDDSWNGKVCVWTGKLSRADSYPCMWDGETELGG